MMYKFDVLEMGDNGSSIKKTEEKIIYSIDSGEKLSEWVRKELLQTPSQNKGVRPHLSSALKVSNSSHQKDIINGFLGSYIGLSNSVEENGSGVILGSSTMTRGNAKVSLSVINSNFFKIICTFTSRKLVVKTWKNNKDEYFAPNEEHEQYKQFTNDSIVYSLFNNSSQQSSLRQVTYKDQLWDIKNEFFWMSKEEIMDIANNNNYNELYSDARTENNRYVHNLLFGEQNIYEKLSPDAKLVLDKATELTKMSMTMRSHFADDHNHLNSWDAGYAQLKLVWKEYFPNEFKEFRQLYKNLEDRMRPLVYELGFLLK